MKVGEFIAALRDYMETVPTIIEMGGCIASVIRFENTYLDETKNFKIHYSGDLNEREYIHFNFILEDYKGKDISSFLIIDSSEVNHDMWLYNINHNDTIGYRSKMDILIMDENLNESKFIHDMLEHLGDEFVNIIENIATMLEHANGTMKSTNNSDLKCISKC